MKPIASLSLDLDNKWSYMKTHGDAGWESFPSYLDTVVPRVLEFLREREDQKITFFIVGQDAALDKNRAALRSIADAGHEIGNHSFKHEPWLHLYTDAEIEREFDQVEEAILSATGARPVGFRGPGFSFSPYVLRTLARRGYLYDASTFPTFLGPLARAYYFMTARLDKKQQTERKALFGKLSDGLRPLKPYRWQLDDDAANGANSLVEIPVTTMPVFKVPIHASYILYLSTFSEALARAYFRSALMMCRATHTPLSLLLHPLDFLGGDDDGDLSFFPAMNMRSEKKLELMSDLISMMQRDFQVLTMREHAAEVTHSGTKVAQRQLCLE